MKLVFRFSLFSVLLAAILFVGTRPSHSDTRLQQPAAQPSNHKRIARRDKPMSYRSPGAHHKLAIRKNDADIERSITTSGRALRVKRYSDFSLIEMDDAQLAELGPDQLARVQLRDDWNLVMLRRGQLDTTGPEPAIAANLRQQASQPVVLHLVQLFGPPTTGVFNSLTATGAKVVAYVPNNAYLVWGTQQQ